mmetsp:Transcript_28575/g.40188  ORF Transcript_28575/g.40188 Transcript_28575/m.40188 type:complete len:207 (+) Transcript_28575:373-993(+)
METQKKHSDVSERSSRRKHHQSRKRSKTHNRILKESFKTWNAILRGSSTTPSNDTKHVELTNQNKDNKNNKATGVGEEGRHRDKVQTNPRLQDILGEHAQKINAALQNILPKERKAKNSTTRSMPESPLPGRDDFDVSPPRQKKSSIAEDFQKRDLKFAKNNIWEESVYRFNLVLEDCRLVFQRRHTDYSKGTTISEVDISEHSQS